MLTNDLAKAALAFGAIAALGALGCERRDEDSRRVANRVEEKVERTGERVEQAGKDITPGVAYEVAKIDKEAKTVEVRIANAMPGVTGKETIVFTFDELAAKVEGDTPGNEIADELRVGENVSVFMDANRNIQKITYERSRR